MSSGMVFQVLVNLIFAAGFVAIWIRLNKPAKDDPRLSRGLQLLQSKIAILEDLSDQVERQVQQVAQLMEIKARDLQQHIEKSDDQIRQIESATSKSLEVAKIFQDRIPHEEIIDRKSTLKYVKAARLANKGLSVEAIADQVDLSRGEIEFVANVNREQLQFSEEDLPDWAREGAESANSSEEGTIAPKIESPSVAEEQPLLRVSDRSIEPLDQLGRRFREAFETGVDRPATMASAATTSGAALGRRADTSPAVLEKPKATGPVGPSVPTAADKTAGPAPFNRESALAAKRNGERIVQRVVFPSV